jgi:tetratricopeptide (TPR) repeat protein
MDLLFLLASRPGDVLSREEIGRALWPGVHVGEDALARTVFKLRKALDDDPRRPEFVETIPKRGYRLIAAVSAEAPAAPSPVARRSRKAGLALATGAALLVVLGGAAAVVFQARGDPAAALVAEADDYYFQYRRADNEAALLLYERAIALDPNDAAALSGLSNTLVQRLVRWPGGAAGPEIVEPSLGKALDSGALDTAAAQASLRRAEALAERAAELAPDDARVLRSLGLVLSARRDERARAVYAQALREDPDAWGVLVNLAELERRAGDRAGALARLERAYQAMERTGREESVRTRPWRPALGVQIAREHEALGRPDRAEQWHRRVLAYAPLHADAVRGLAGLLRAGGDAAAAEALCRDLLQRTGEACAIPPG